MCLDIPNGMVTVRGLKLWIWQCDGNRNAQQFKIVKFQTGYRIVADWDGNTLKMCVAYDGSLGNRTVHHYDENGHITTVVDPFGSTSAIQKRRWINYCQDCTW
jgi:hypothetical protein